AARVFRRPGERPLMVLIHGYRGGNYRVEEKLWPVRWFLRRGVDVALFTLPFHGVRRKDTPFFTYDPRVTIETLRQAIIDLRALLAAVRGRHKGVGVAGMSLGGYTTALLATVEPLDLVCPFIPLGSFADSARDSGWLNGSPAEQSIQYAAIERAYAAIDPFQRVPKAEPERCVVIAGAGDRITPATQAERLAEHFKAECVRFPGGHLMQTGRKRGFLALEQRMVRAGWL
ncbi:MAG: alpha/beta hydrolase, partial [Myxococcota bacterium]